VTRRAGKRSQDSPWEFFGEWLAGAAELKDPGPQRAPATGAVVVTDADIAQAEAAVAARWRVSGAPTYEVRGAKELAMSAAELHRRPAAGEHGTEWGTVIHFLLEMAMREPGSDLLALARTALEEQGLATSRALEALSVVAAVRASAIWRRAAGAARTLVEVPFEIRLDPGDPLLGIAGEGAGESRGKSPSLPLWQRGTPGDLVPVLVRGVVDLAFREPAGWVILDWKTDAARTPAELAARVRHYAPQVRLYGGIWSRITGEPVTELGLFFTAADRYETL